MPVDPPVSPPKVFLTLLDGPDLQSAKKVTGQPTVMTSCGEIDRDTAIMGRVGGVGTVSIQQMT